ncbi:MAG: S8 family peptidase [Armatimonadota bacterium]
MATRPIVIFPEATPAARNKKGGGQAKVHCPGFTRQSERILPQLDVLEHQIEARKVQASPDMPTAEPEMVLVIETIGSISDFMRAVDKVEGLEWLAEWDEYDIAADEDFYIEEHPENPLSGRLYLVMSNHAGVSQLTSLWRRYSENPEHPEFERGYTKWRDLFRQLRNVRPWGPIDRLYETGLKEEFDGRVKAGEESVVAEVEIWFVRDEAKRSAAEAALRILVGAEGGEIIQSTCIPEIRYHALSARLPITSVEKLFTHEAELIKCEQVMYFRPHGQLTVGVPDDMPVSDDSVERETEKSTGDPVVALLDGLPLEHHKCLENRLIIDDPEAWAAEYPASERVHGTAMASLILHGDLAAMEQPLPRPVYVRPILRPYGPDWLQSSRQECLPEGMLAVDLIHRAVKRLFDGEAGEQPVAPSVRIVNLSIGDRSRLFDRTMSPLARLLDWLAWKYRVLFMVSAGNHPETVVIDCNGGDIDTIIKDKEFLRKSVVSAVARAVLTRRLMSPSESVNSLTVAAHHYDFLARTPLGNSIDPLDHTSLPSPVNAQGPGFRRFVKPDLLFAGGRQHYSRDSIGAKGNIELRPIFLSNHFGQEVASTSSTPGQINAVRFMCGTSNATALASRSAAMIYDMLNHLKGSPGGDRLTNAYESILLKALLVHSATWQTVTELTELDVDTVMRLIGYGIAEPDRVMACTDQRITLLGWGNINKDEGHNYKLPLPASLNGVKCWRRLTITLAWFTPVNCAHQAYRQAHVWFKPYQGSDRQGDCAKALQVSRCGVDWQAALRGTLQHEVFEGDSASVFSSQSDVQIHVSCSEDAGRLTETVPYGLAVTLEVAPETKLPLYEDIVARIRPVVRIAPGLDAME